MNVERLDIYFINYIGVGLGWDSFLYDVDLIIHLPFLCIRLGLGREK